MKYLSRILVFAFAIISAAACYNNEIEDPENPQAPERSGLRITATMAKTRVSYGNENDYELLPVWEKGDILFGFYVESGEIKNFILKVTDVDTEGAAELDFVEGQENGLADQPVATRVFLIYTGKNGESSIDLSTDAFSAAGEFSVDLTSQYLERVPVCMSATASIEGTANAKTLSFSFDYDCAILEINSLTGFGEEGFTSGTLSSIEVTDVIQQGTYSLDNNSLVFSKAADASAATYEIDFSESAVTGGKTWRIDENGIIVNNDGKEGVLIAAVPGEAKSKLTVTGKTTVGADSHDFSFDYGSYRLEKGNCYVIGAKDVVAKTADGKYFKTVTAAFAHADTLYQDSKANTVTLLRNCGLAGIDATGVPVVGASAPIDIDGYNVTLDLNGKTLSLGSDDYDECFRVNCDEEDEGTSNTNEFIIMDSRGNGIINANTDDYLIKSWGEVNIEGGMLAATCAVLHNFYECTISGGELVNINQSGDCVITNEKHDLKITGGKLESSNCEIIKNASGTVYIGTYGSNVGPTLYSEEGTCISNEDGDVNIYAGTIENNSTSSGQDSYADPAISVISGNVFISAGGEVISNYGCAIDSGESDSITIAGGKISSKEGLAISVCDCSNFLMSSGEVSGKDGGIQLYCINDQYSAGSISGGTVESDDGYALYVENSKCTLSGGKILCKSTTKPAVSCFSDIDHIEYFDEESPNLLITWPTGGESAGGPLIVSSSVTFDDKSFGAVSTANPIDEKTHEEITNYAIVEISGGYLSSSDDAFCSIAGNSSLLLTGSFYTNIGGGSPGSFKSPYYDFSSGSSVYVPSENVNKSVIYCEYEYQFAFKISPEWTYVIDNCSQTKTEIGADEEVTYSFRSYKQRGTEKVAVPWIAQMFVGSNAGNGWRDNHDYGNDGEQLHWTTNIDDAGDGSADSGLGSTDDPEEYKITFMSTASDTYKVRIIASDDDGSITYEFAPVVQTISSTPSSDSIVLYEGSSTNQVTISYNSFDDAGPKPENILRVSFSLTDPNAKLENVILKIYDAWSENTIEFNLASSVTVGSNQYYCENILESEWISSVLSRKLDLTLLLDWGGVITKVELIQ